ncbi:lantibiotic dehydratase [Pedobacter rhodius]|uniref:Thiopeptide-type bacteriocin biosynthesis protein n=1 Tax=Pedobacter rhodius TaxID=3004098 RepID=A0ABT4L2H5_9SPHI|nr:lantibiotic dehydratase [Pedobacter sp. SJ11]MCZ4225393.1 thiopeptide-type bacteriocin biosynthesis protein [Pedobacter sp. SJ11]
MKVNIHRDLIFRTPRFSYQSELADCWEELKKAISISSEAFYQTIKEVKAEELTTLNPKVLFTVWKYYNRAKFRSTPYGTFAGFSMLKDALSTASSQIVLEEKQLVHQFIDWPYKNNLNFSLPELLQNNCFLFANSSYYFTTTSIRYIACTDGLFELAEIDKDEFVIRILKACLKPIRVNELIKNLDVSVEVQADVLSLLEDMLSLQLLLSDVDPNIIGEDYFDRIHVNPVEGTPKYLIAERNTISGGLDEKMFYAVPGLINLMQHILPVDGRDALKQFVNKFKKKFEQKEVPLSMALDPEMGIGYDELEQAGQGDEFINQFFGKQDKKSDDLNDKLKQNFKKLIHPKSFRFNETIKLDKLGLPLADKPTVLPNSFSMLLSVSDDLICVDQTGGSTANALSGRFTMANDKVYQHCKKIGQIEQAANPDILFFDVAYMVETNVDNINRRKLVYDNQLSILNFDTSENPLTLDDIMLSVQGNEVVLRSKKLNKRVVPRMASAYNYARSDLSVFRLLCDLQHQNIQTNLTLFLESLYPELPYYPRLQYQNIVLSQQRWLVKKADVSSLNLTDLRNYLNKLGVSANFKAGLSDQTLCFDKNIDLDLNAFLQYMLKQDKVYLEEVLIPEKSVVVDEKGNPYLAQFILNIYHQEKIYNGFSQPALDETSVKQFFPPGKEWLYFEIYCHQQRSDTLLSGPIAQFLDTYSNQIKSWFFIRYNENGYHLRFRLLLNDEKDGQILTAAFSAHLEEDLAAGLVSDLQLRTYRRETQRYGNDLIEEVEKHFSADSRFVLSLFETHPDALSKYKYCSDLIDKIQQEALFEDKVFADVIRMMSDSFNEEHHLDASDFKKINAQYQVYRKSAYLDLNQDQLYAFNSFANSFINILKTCKPDKKIQLFSDLLHMHVNRLFNKDQRTHEMVIYYFLLKDVQRRNAMK